MAPGATLAQARSEIGDIRKKVRAQYPDAYDPGSHYQVSVTPFQEVLGERARLTLWLLMGAAGFVLVIACANAANLTLMRGVRREQELVIRSASGAGTDPSWSPDSKHSAAAVTTGQGWTAMIDGKLGPIGASAPEALRPRGRRG